MKWAFWKSKRPRRSAAARSAQGAPDLDPEFEARDLDAEAAAAHELRVRTRRRLVGACALLLAVVVIVPMVLDPTPRAIPDNIPIELPSDRTPFAPQIPPPVAASPAPPAAAPAAEPAAPVPAAPGSAADSATAAAPPPPAARPEEVHPQKKEQKEPKEHARHAAEAPAPAVATVAQGHIFVQAAALASETAANELAGRIVAKAGLTPFVERAQTSEGTRFRVRLGPYGSRQDADQVQKRLKSMGMASNIVVVGAG